MAEIPILGHQGPPAPDAGHVTLELTNQLLTGCIASMLAMQSPMTAITAGDVLNLLCEHVGKILALFDNEQTRNMILADIRRNLPGVVNRHLLARSVDTSRIMPVAAQPQRMQ